MIYLDNAATGGFKPASVLNAVSASLKLCVNPGRSGHRLAIATAQRVYACRSLLSELFQGYGPERVVFTKNCTEGLNLSILGVLEKGDHVVASTLEHNSVLRPLEYLKQRGEITYSIAPLTNGTITPEAVASLVTQKTRLVIVTSASNVTGVCPDLKAIRARLPKHVLFLVDGAQGAGHIPLQMQETGIDLLALAGHKGLHAIQGASALLFSDRVNPRPLLFGGTGSLSMNLDMPNFYPDRLESGTISYPAVSSLFEGALIVKSSLKSHAQKLEKITQVVCAEIQKMPAFTLYSAPNACGIVSFAHMSMPSDELATTLSERFDIAVRGGLHCAPLAHKALGTKDGLVRASFSPYQPTRDAALFLKALHRL